MTVSVNIRKTLGALTIDAWFECGRGVTALFGKSGAGKTSIVQMLAGLMTPDNGRIAIDGTSVYDSATGLNVAPERRHVGYVFQDARLFPHMNVRRNLDYGARRKSGRAGSATGPGVDDVVDRRPGVHRHIGRVGHLQPSSSILCASSRHIWQTRR